METASAPMNLVTCQKARAEKRARGILFFLVLCPVVLLAIPRDGVAERWPVVFERLTVAGGDHPNGIFDIAVEYGDDGIGWLAYSEVELPKYVETHLARSTDNGKTWNYVSVANKSVDGALFLGGKRVDGVWRYETPTLVFDATDTPERRWKLFVQKYFAKPPFKKGDSFFGRGHIEYSYAARPDGKWSVPTCLFGKQEHGCRVDLNGLDPSLREVVFYNEIGSAVVDGTLYLSLDASTTENGLGEWEKRKIVLIASSDHGESWRFVGMLTNHDDATQFGYQVLTGSSLVQEGRRMYLLATPSGRKGLFVGNRGHDGTLIFAFEDIARARLRRDKTGQLVALRHIRPSLHSGGLSDYHEKNTHGGILFSQFDPRSPPKVFKTFNTRTRIAY